MVAPSAAEPVHLDRLGAPEAASEGESSSEPRAGAGESSASSQQAEDAPAVRLRLRCVGVPQSGRERLAAVGAELHDEPDAEVDAWIVSTRVSPADLDDFRLEFEEHDVRTVVLAHTGAERLAVELVEAGAYTVVGEGNEEALLGLVDEARTPNALLTSFERRFGSSEDAAAGGADPGTGLPGPRAFERRISTLGDADEVARVAFCKILSDRWTTPNPDPVVAVQRRRLATAMAHVCSAWRAEIHVTGPGEFGLVGVQLSPHAMDRLGDRLVAAASTFRDGGAPLRLVVGHAGPETSVDREELMELARRALEVAAVDGVRTVLGAEDLARGVSVTTELEAIVRLLDRIEPSLPEGPGHGERVGRLTAELARLHGWSSSVVARAQLAGHLHDVGRAGLSAEAVRGPAGLDEEGLVEWRTFPARSAELLALTAGATIAATVRAQRERWDGTGFPDGLREADIPEAARLLALGHAIDELCSGEAAGFVQMANRLRERAGTELDPDLVDLAIANLPALLAARG